jgi:hypothetical protein
MALRVPGDEAPGAALPVAALESGEVPPFRAVLGLLLAAAFEDPAMPSDAFVSAYATLSGTAANAGAVRLILSGRASFRLLRRYALRPLTRTSIQQAVQFFRLRERMIRQAA